MHASERKWWKMKYFQRDEIAQYAAPDIKIEMR